MSEAVSRSCSVKKVFSQNFAKNFSKFTGTHLRQRLFFSKVVDLRELY